MVPANEQQEKGMETNALKNLNARIDICCTSGKRRPYFKLQNAREATGTKPEFMIDPIQTYAI